MKSLRLAATFLCALWAAPLSSAAANDVTVTHALAEFGEPALESGFPNFAYVNPEAPKGGTIRLAAPGTFDTLNTVPLLGQYPRSIGLISDSLMVGSGDEIGVVYGLIAQTVSYPEDVSWAVFDLREDARWHDGRPITARDFVFAWNAIQEHGNPFLKSFLSEVATVEAEADHRLKVTFTTQGKIKPLINVATSLSPEPEHWWTAQGRDIARTTLEPRLGSGPYRIAAVDPGRSITYERVTDYWARDLNVAVGQYNFDTVRYDYYRDDDVMFEAFKAGAYDYRVEFRSQRWTGGYDIAQVRDGRIETRAIPDETPQGAQGFRLNTRREKLADPRVRLALNHLFDFGWIQKNILYGQYERDTSNFPNSDFGASGPPTPEELAILEKYRGKIPEEVLTAAYEPPTTDGSGNIRANLRQALALFREAGWETRDGRLVNARTGAPFTIEFLEDSPSMVRVIEPYVATLRRAGISADIRIVDSAQMQRRTDDFDFDTVVAKFNFFPPPGPELRSYFGSAAADTKGSANYSGIKDPVVDALIEEILAAEDLETLKATTRALDRVLLWGHYMVPQWHNDEHWLAYWTKFGWPERNPRYDASYGNSGFPATWWYDAERAERLAASR